MGQGVEEGPWSRLGINAVLGVGMYYYSPNPSPFPRHRTGGIDPASGTDQVEGRVEDLSYWENELGLLIRGEFWLFHVPDHCPVRCAGRPARVETLRHWDRVRITYSTLRNTLVAEAIDAEPARDN